MTTTVRFNLGIAMSLLLSASAFALPGKNSANTARSNGPIRATVPKLDLKVGSSVFFLSDLRARVAAGKNQGFAKTIARQMKALPAEHAAVASELVAQGLNGYVEQAIQAHTTNPDGSFPEARVARLDLTGKAEGGYSLPTFKQVPGLRSIEAAERDYMSAHDDPRMKAASEKAANAELVFNAGGGGGHGASAMDRYRATVVAAENERTATLARVREEKMGAATVASFQSLSAMDRAQASRYGGRFADKGSMENVIVTPAQRLASTTIHDYGPNLYNTIRSLDFAANAINTPDPKPGTLRATMNKMMNAPSDFLAVYALTNNLFGSASSAKGLEAAALKHVASIPKREREFLTLFSEMSKMRQTANGVVMTPAHDIEILHTLAASLGAPGPKGVASNAVAHQSGPSGYALGLMINHAYGNDSWTTNSLYGKPRVQYENRFAPPWVKLATK